MNVERFVVAFTLASLVFCPLCWWAIVYDRPMWRPALRRMFFAVLVLCATFVTAYAIEVVPYDACAQLTKADLLWWILPCW